MPQMQLPIFPEGTTSINESIGFVKKDGKITYFYGHLPVFIHDTDDVRSFRMFTSQLYVNGTVKQAEICRAFGVTSIGVKRGVKRYRERGTSGFYEQRRQRGPAVLIPSVIEKAQYLLDNNAEIADVSEELGIKRDTLRKAIASGKLHQTTKKKKKLGKNMLYS